MNLAEVLRGNLVRNLSAAIEKLSPTAQLRTFGLLQIPLIFLVNPKVEKITDTDCEVRISLNYMTRNHLKSMYFGTLAIGADATIALFAMHIAKKRKDTKVSVVFKDFKADFIKRAEADVVFRCASGEQIGKMIARAAATDTRVTEGVDVEAVSAHDPSEVFARMTLGLSVRAKKS